MGHSGLQKEVLSLYRLCLRACRSKPGVSGNPLPACLPACLLFCFHFGGIVNLDQLTTCLPSPGRETFHEQDARRRFETFVRKEFAKNVQVNKKDYAVIEFLLRKGHKQLEAWGQPWVRNIHA